MNAQNITLSGSEKIDSQQLLLMVNETRKEHGVPAIRNNVFIDRIKDELECHRSCKTDPLTII